MIAARTSCPRPHGWTPLPWFYWQRAAINQLCTRPELERHTTRNVYDVVRCSSPHDNFIIFCGLLNLLAFIRFIQVYGNK